MKATSPTTFSVKNAIGRYSLLFLEMPWVLSTRWRKSMRLHLKRWRKRHHPLLVLPGNDTSVQLYSFSMKEINVNTTGQWRGSNNINRFVSSCQFCFFLAPAILWWMRARQHEKHRRTKQTTSFNKEGN